MNSAAIPFPLNEVLAENAYSHHQELQPEPVVPEPEKQIGAEYDWEGAESQNPLIFPEPADQHIESVDKRHLRQNQRNVRVNLGPVETPIRVYARVHGKLHVVRSYRDEFPG